MRIGGDGGAEEGAVFSGRHPLLLVKEAVEGGAVRDAYQLGDLVYGQGGGAQELLRAVDPQLDQVFGEG